MKPLLRFAKLFVAFFFVLAGSYSAWTINHSDLAIGKTEPTLRCIGLIAAGLTIIWIDYQATRS